MNLSLVWFLVLNEIGTHSSSRQRYQKKAPKSKCRVDKKNWLCWPNTRTTQPSPASRPISPEDYARCLRPSKFYAPAPPIVPALPPCKRWVHTRKSKLIAKVSYHHMHSSSPKNVIVKIVFVFVSYVHRVRRPFFFVFKSGIGGSRSGWKSTTRSPALRRRPRGEARHLPSPTCSRRTRTPRVWTRTRETS